MLCKIQFKSTPAIINDLALAFGDSATDPRQKIEAIFKRIRFPEEQWLVNPSNANGHYLWSSELMSPDSMDIQQGKLNVLFNCTSSIVEDEVCLFLRALSQHQFTLSVEFMHEDDLDNSSGEPHYTQGKGEILGSTNAHSYYARNDPYLIEYFEEKQSIEPLTETIIEMLSGFANTTKLHNELDTRIRHVTKLMEQDHLAVDHLEYAKLPEHLSDILNKIKNTSPAENPQLESIADAISWWTMRIKKLTFRRNQVLRYSSF